VPGGWRLLLIAAGALAAVVLFVVLRADDDEPTTAPPPATSVTIDVSKGPPPPPPVLEILIPINTGEEVHLHGYDVKRRIGPDNVARLPFRATIPGRFEVELEASHRQVADLTVR
jgi:hypothetical protein